MKRSVVVATPHTGRTEPCGRRAVLWCANGSKWHTKTPLLLKNFLSYLF